MELILSLGIGIMTGSGVWLILRPRTYQVIIGLSLLSYAVNLFIFGVGGVKSNAAPLLEEGVPALHFYTMNRSKATREVLGRLGLVTRA